MPRIRYTNRIFLVLLLALTAGFAVASSRLAAQAATPAANTGSSAQSTVQPQPEAAQPEKKSQEEQDKAFLLDGPVVKWTAKTFNLSPELASHIYTYTNFGLLVLLIGVPLFRWLPKFLRARSEKVRSDIESARKVTEDANTRLSAIESKLTGLDGEIDKIRVQVETESRQDETRIKSTIAEESDRIVAAAEQEITASAAQAKRSLRHFAADLAIDQAAKQLVLTPQADQALISEFIRDVAQKNVGKGGQN
jgi:F-type H+-transporting ATPase subunit b